MSFSYHGEGFTVFLKWQCVFEDSHWKASKLVEMETKQDIQLEQLWHILQMVLEMFQGIQGCEKCSYQRTVGLRRYIVGKRCLSQKCEDLSLNPHPEIFRKC